MTPKPGTYCWYVSRWSSQRVLVRVEHYLTNEDGIKLAFSTVLEGTREGEVILIHPDWLEAKEA